MKGTTIHFMFVLEVLLGLKSLQGDVTCAYLHVDLEEYKNAYIDIPKVFAKYGKNGKKMCLKLKKPLYGPVSNTHPTPPTNREV